MSYNYQEQRPRIFTEDGQVMFLKIRDKAHELINSSGVVMSCKLMSATTGDTWMMTACMDRLVELGELREIPNTYSNWGQYRIFIGADI